MPRVKGEFCPRCGEPRHAGKPKKVSVYLDAHTVALLEDAALPGDSLTTTLVEWAVDSIEERKSAFHSGKIPS